MNEAANDSARVSGQDRKIPPALGTSQIAVFGGFRPLASLEKNKLLNDNLSEVNKPQTLLTVSLYKVNKGNRQVLNN